MIVIEVIGLEPPCDKCNELLHNVKQAVKLTGIETRVEKNGRYLPKSWSNMVCCSARRLYWMVSSLPKARCKKTTGLSVCGKAETTA